MWTACALMLILAAGPALGADPAVDPDKEAEAAREHDLLEWPVGDNWLLSPVILPIYSPETEFALVLGGLATWSTRPGDTNVPRSTISFFAIPNSRGGLGFNADLEGFWFGDKLRTSIEFDYDTGPNDYWGVGYEAGKDIEEGEDVTEYERDVIEMPVIVGWRVGQASFVGLNYTLINMDVTEESATMQEDPNYQLYGGQIVNSGLGLRYLYDTRDDTLNAYSGRFFSIDANVFRDELGSDQEFETYSVDYRQYHQIQRPGRTIAWQLYGRRADGDVPWVSMSTVGSSRDLRGYTQGRFRDKSAAWGLVEYRHMTDTRLWKLGRNGFTVWGGLGFIGEDFGDFGGHELPNVGVGYRLEIQPRRSLRVDVGWGYDEVGVYLNFAEAF